MKTISIISGLLISINSVTMAQQADSIVVNYMAQHIKIATPSFGKQTTIKMADSLQMIEISVSRRKISDISKQALNPSNSYISQKPKNKVKWFSQLEAGYTISIPNPDKLSLNDQYYSFRGGNFIGYKIALSVREKVRSINSKSFLATGFKLGYEQSFREIEVGVNGYSHGPVFRSSFYQMIFPIESKNKIAAFKTTANITFGANFILGYSFVSRKNNLKTESVYDNVLFFLEPFLGIGFNKVGFRIASSRNLAPEMSSYNPIKAVNSISLTYKIR